MDDIVGSTAATDNMSDAASAATESAGRYATLIERALEFVRSRGGAVHEDLLIAHVFGNTGHVKMWKPLIRQALAPCPDFTLRADEHWVVPEMERITASDSGSILPEFVAIDVETTGTRPASQRIIEVAAVRFKGGEVVDRFESLVNPGRAIPRAIVELTGIRDIDVVNAPKFADIASRLLEFIGASVLVGHNVRFDVGFIDAELRRCGRPILANERIDTVGLSTRLVPGLRKPSLDRVATTLGIPGRDIHRAGIDAEICGKVAVKLIALAQEAGLSNVDIIKALANSTGARPKDGLGRSRTMMDRSLLKDVPKAPGVYIMKDKYGHIIYVGKAKNLRDRVGSYYSQPIGYTRKMDGLIEHLAELETIVVGSELEALLLESQLIRRYQPRYNTALRSSERYPYIRLDISHAWPRLTLAKARQDDDALYFGPYRSTSGARKTVDFLNDALPLRTCTRTFRDARSYGSPCIRLDLKKCLGPCVGRADVDEYRRLVRDIAHFLSGDETALLDRLTEGLQAAAEKLDFERAAKIRNHVQTALQLAATQREMRIAEQTHTLLLVQPSANDGHRTLTLVVEGRRWAQFDASPSELDDFADRLHRSWERYLRVGVAPLDHESVDESAILNRWLAAHQGHPSILLLPDRNELTPPRWRDLLIEALSRTDAELTAPPIPAEDDDDALDDLVSAGTDGYEEGD